MSSSSQLPPSTSSGVFTVSKSILIDAPIEKVWFTLLDFQSYHEWNSFVRGQAIVDPETHQALSPSVSLAEGQTIHIDPVHLPPTFDKPAFFQKTSSYEIVTAVDSANHRLAWKFTGVPEFLLRAERWQILTREEGEGGSKTKYETFEVFGGVVAYLVKVFQEKNLNLGFEAMAEGLKARAEGN